MSSSGYAKAKRRIDEALRADDPYLDLSGLGLETLPPEIGQLTDLTQLVLSQNQLTTLSPELGQLTNLTELYLYRNQLTTLPPDLKQLANLTHLELDQNRLTTLPPELGQLSNLTKLSLHQNQLTTLPTELGQLVRLTELVLLQNRLTTLPPELGRLSKLVWLYLSQNRLTTLPPELGRLSNLTWLDLSQNRLTILLPELGQLSKLTRLDLSQNQLMILPPELGQLINLRELDVSQNQLTILPSELGYLTNLEELVLNRNPDLSSPSPEVIAQGRHAIMTYLKARQNEDEPQWLSKLLIVGEGGVGKTSLLRAIKGEPFQVQQSTTHGIEITTLPLAHPTETGVTMVLNAWDFGGQEIYHATHQFFLTNRSLFLLAFNARLGFEQGKLIYWLKTIRANAPESPIILVATYTDERDADLPFTDIKAQFPNIVSLYEVSNRTGKGIPTLRQALIYTTANLPLMGERWPTTWLNFANNIRAGIEKQTTPQTFFAGMEKSGISKDGETRPSKMASRTWRYSVLSRRRRCQRSRYS